MTLVRKKLSKSGWILLAVVAVVLVSLPILHFTGVFPLDFLGNWAQEVAVVAESSGWMAAAIGIGCAAIGFGTCYVLKDYVIGMEGANLQITQNTGTTYNPLPTQPTVEGAS